MVRSRLSLTECLWARWRCAATSTSTPPTGLSGQSRDWSSIPATTTCPTSCSTRATCWAKKRVAIPIGAVAGVGDGVRLSLSKDEVRDLPPVDLR